MTDPEATGSTSTVWYQHRMLWLVIGIPALTVIGCMFTIYLAISNPDFKVSDDSAADVVVAPGDG